MDVRVKAVMRSLIYVGGVLVVALGWGFPATVNAGGSATPPAWVNNIAPGTWGPIGINTLQDVDPEDDPATNPRYPADAEWHGVMGQQCVLVDWTGGAYASGFGTHGAMIYYGGGHHCYYGSEVYAFDLGSLMWIRVTDPWPGPYSSFYPTGQYPDGSPLPPHTYDKTEYLPGSNSLLLAGGDTEWGTHGGGLPIIYMLDLDTREWRRSPQTISGLYWTTGAMSCYDRNREAYWIVGSDGPGTWTKFKPESENADGTYGTFTHYALRQESIYIDAGAECDPNNDIMVFTQYRNGDAIYARDLSNPEAPRVRLSQTGDQPSKSGQHGWSWSDKRQAFLYFQTGGTDVYEYKLTSGDWATGTWTWSKLTVASNTVGPSVGQNGVYSRFRVVRWGDVEVAVVANRWDGPAYAFRIPDPAEGDSAVFVTLNAGSRNLQEGTSTTLTWESTNSTTCIASGAWSGTKGTSGSATVGPLNSTSPFRLDCENAAGASGHDSVQITVASETGPANILPVITGTPPETALSDTDFSFVPFASDVNNDPLSFSIICKPEWASFDTATGELSGIPRFDEIGLTSVITISVSDGVGSTSLPVFDLTVTDGGRYSGTLSWMPALLNEDGSTLDDLAGYKIHYRMQSQNDADTIRIDGTGVTSHVLEDLSAGTYYLAVSGFDTSLNESVWSEEIVGVLGVNNIPYPETESDPECGPVPTSTAMVSSDEEGSSSSGMAVSPFEMLLALALLIVGPLRGRSRGSSRDAQ